MMRNTRQVTRQFWWSARMAGVLLLTACALASISACETAPEGSPFTEVAVSVGSARESAQAVKRDLTLLNIDQAVKDPYLTRADELEQAALELDTAMQAALAAPKTPGAERFQEQARSRARSLNRERIRLLDEYMEFNRRLGRTR